MLFCPLMLTVSKGITVLKKTVSLRTVTAYIHMQMSSERFTKTISSTYLLKIMNYFLQSSGSVVRKEMMKFSPMI